MDSQSDFEVELDSMPSSATNSSFVTDFGSVTNYDSVAEDQSRPAIL